MASATMATANLVLKDYLGAILKEFYLPPIVAMLNQSILLDHFGGDRSRAAAMAELAERLTLLLRGGALLEIPEELHEVGHILGFYDGAFWALPPDHPYSLTPSVN